MKTHKSRLPTLRSRLPIHTPPEAERAGRSVYKSERWKQLSASLRRAVTACQSCGKRARLVVDHRIELKDGGDPWAPSNLICLCWPCHAAKTAERKRAREAARGQRGLPGPPGVPPGGDGVSYSRR